FFIPLPFSFDNRPPHLVAFPTSHQLGQFGNSHRKITDQFVESLVPLVILQIRQIDSDWSQTMILAVVMVAMSLQPTRMRCRIGIKKRIALMVRKQADFENDLQVLGWDRCRIGWIGNLRDKTAVLPECHSKSLSRT
ncbi:MAG TPA: hypothetical protein VF920_13880, partial [Dongiaceae bacterium]